MKFFFYLFQVTLISGLLFGYYSFFLKNNRFHSYNRYYILAAVLLSMVLPLVDIPVYFSTGQFNNSNILTGFKKMEVYTLPEYVVTVKNGFSKITILKALYGVIIITCFIYIGLAIAKLVGLLRESTIEKVGDIKVVHTHAPNAPFSFFNWLFWNDTKDVSTKDSQIMWSHELYHIKQCHSIDVVLLHIVTAVFWINPFFYLFKKEQHAIHEFLADAYACKPGSQWDYAELLLMQAFSTHH